jgi:hypothetical protein
VWRAAPRRPAPIPAGPAGHCAPWVRRGQRPSSAPVPRRRAGRRGASTGAPPLSGVVTGRISTAGCHTARGADRGNQVCRTWQSEPQHRGHEEVGGDSVSRRRRSGRRYGLDRRRRPRPRVGAHWNTATGDTPGPIQSGTTMGGTRRSGCESHCCVSRGTGPAGLDRRPRRRHTGGRRVRPGGICARSPRTDHEPDARACFVRLARPCVCVGSEMRTSVHPCRSGCRHRLVCADPLERVWELVSPTWSVQARPRAPPAAMSSGRVASLFW